MAPTRVLIADDHALLRDGLHAAIGALGDALVVGEAADGHEAARLYAELLPDVVILDIEMPGLDGLATLALLRQRHPGCRALMLTSFAGDARIARALALGACGYLLKMSSKEVIVDAIRQVAAGGAVISPEANAQLERVAPRSVLHPREVECLALASQGFDTKGIASQLSVPVDTVKTRMKSAFGKLGVNDRVRAVAVALERGFI